MEGQGCQQTSLDPPELQSPGPALVRLPTDSPRPASFSSHHRDHRVREIPSFRSQHRQASAGEREFQVPVVFPAVGETVIQPVIYPTNLASSSKAEDKEESFAAAEPEPALTPVKPAETGDSSPSFDCPSHLVVQKQRLPDLPHTQKTVFSQWPLHGTRSRYATAPPRAHLHPLPPTAPAAPATQKPVQRRNREVSRERPAILTKLMEKFNVRDWSRPETHPGVTSDRDEDASRITPEDSAPSSSQHTHGEVKILYPRLRCSESSFVPPNSAPLIQPAASNTLRPQPELPVTTERGNRLGLRKISSAPAFPRSEMNTEDLSRLLNRDVPPQSNMEGIILGGPSSISTQQGPQFTDGGPERVRSPAIPIIHGVFEGTVAPATPS
ncbi:hypothetical protein FQN49_008392, partial [Arthroderma sp. PD_2]